jgi:two-component system, OmpR family, phosphate regulon sensor histidine kinase PhoR
MAASILLAAEDTRWTQHLSAVLHKAGYQIRLMSENQSLPQVIEQDHPDIVILSPDPRYTLFAETLRQVSSLPRPLIVLISNTPHSPHSDDLPIDIVLPTDPVILEQQLTTFLHLHHELHQTRTAFMQQQQQNFMLQKRLDEQQKANNEIELLKNAIVRNISHELKTPLLQVKSAVNLLGELGPDSDQRESVIELAKNATSRLEGLVKNVTLLGSSLDINIGPIILRDTIEYTRRNLVRMLQRPASDVERVRLHITDNLPPVQADKQGLTMVFQLLLDNALKFSKSPALVDVVVERSGAFARVEIQDHGIGIEAEKLKHIFEIFYQVDNSTTRRYGGAGVGLALVKLILEAHKTDIHVKSVPGYGSTFWFDLPLVEL